MAELLIRNGADVNAKSDDGYTPLHMAAGSGFVDVVHVLLAKGATVDAADNAGSTPLKDAAFMGRADVVKALLAAKADPNAKTAKGSPRCTTPRGPATRRCWTCCWPRAPT